jgi:hypothetical protein
LAEDKKAWKVYFKARLKLLQDLGLSGSLASKTANAEVKALAAAYDFFAALDELRDAGMLKVAGELWAEFYATLLIGLPKEDRKKFMKIVLKVAEDMDKEIEAVE